MNQHQVRFSSTFEEADLQAISITNRLKGFYETRLNNELEFNLNFVIRELLNNAVEHGNQLQPQKQVQCRVLYDEEAIIIEVTDEGEGFEESKRSVAQTLGDHLSMPVRQRGLWLVEQLGYSLSISNNTIRATYYWRVKHDNETGK